MTERVEIRIRGAWATPNGLFRDGDIVRVAAETADRLCAAGKAERVDPVGSAPPAAGRQAASGRTNRPTHPTGTASGTQEPAESTAADDDPADEKRRDAASTSSKRRRKR